MNKGIALHIGVGSLSTKHYYKDAPLSSPLNDAQSMAGIARKEGYSDVRLLTNEQATRANVLYHLDACIRLLNPGDTFLLSYSGHGGQQVDTNGDEEDGMDETWCLYDGLLLDDVIGERWSNICAGARVIIVSACCHSGSNIRPWEIAAEGRSFTPPLSKRLTPRIGLYPEDQSIRASILHMAACEDPQEAQDGPVHSRFTALLLKHWNDGLFSGTYEDFVTAIYKEAGYNQRSGILLLGDNSQDLRYATPFKLLTQK